MQNASITQEKDFQITNNHNRPYIESSCSRDPESIFWICLRQELTWFLSNVGEAWFVNPAAAASATVLCPERHLNLLNNFS